MTALARRLDRLEAMSALRRRSAARDFAALSPAELEAVIALCDRVIAGESLPDADAAELERLLAAAPQAGSPDAQSAAAERQPLVGRELAACQPHQPPNGEAECR